MVRCCEATTRCQDAMTHSKLLPERCRLQRPISSCYRCAAGCNDPKHTGTGSLLACNDENETKHAPLQRNNDHFLYFNFLCISIQTTVPNYHTECLPDNGRKGAYNESLLVTHGPFQSSIANCLLPVAHCPLPVAHCLLPVAHCLLNLHPGMIGQQLYHSHKTFIRPGAAAPFLRTNHR